MSARVRRKKNPPYNELCEKKKKKNYVIKSYNNNIKEIVFDIRLYYNVQYTMRAVGVFTLL